MKYSFLLFAVFISISIFSQNTEYWGVTDAGGEYAAGTIIKLDSNFNDLEVVYDFKIDNKGQGFDIYKQMELLNGKFYLISDGARPNRGNLNEYDPITNQYNTLLDFGDIDSATNFSSNIVEHNGYFYGIASYFNGNLNNGYKHFFFRYELSTNSFYRDVFLADTVFPNNGMKVEIVKNGNKFYTMSSNKRIIEYNMSTNSFVYKNYFQNSGNIYSLLFSKTIVNSNNSFIVFNSYNDKFYNYNYLTDNLSFLGEHQALYNIEFCFIENNNLFITDPYLNGKLYKYEYTNNIMHELIDFDTLNYYPKSHIIKSNNNNIGVLQNKSSNQYIIYDYNTQSNTITNLKTLSLSNSYRQMTLKSIDSNNILIIADRYIATDFFIYNISNNTLTKKMESGSSDSGKFPVGSLFEHPNGKLYGMAEGGKNNCGVIYSFNTDSNSYKTEIHFSDFGYSIPKSSFILHPDGNKLIGVCGGSVNNSRGGALFTYNPDTKLLIVLKDFVYQSNAYCPSSVPALDTNGILYGVTLYGSAGGKLYSFDLNTNTYTNLAIFNSSVSGSLPISTPILTLDGDLYGTTITGSIGPNYEMGVLYKYDISANTLSGVKGFYWATVGRNPVSNLLKYQYGSFYGTTFSMGSGWGGGSIYEYVSYLDTLIIRHNFDSTGYICKTSLTKSVNGLLYGMTSKGGQYNYGAVFEYNPFYQTFTNKVYLNDSTGYIYINPSKIIPYGIEAKAGFSFIKTNICYKTFSDTTISNCTSFTSPSGNHTYFNTGVYYDTLINANGCDSIIRINYTNLSPNTNIVLQNTTLTSLDTNSSYQWLDCDNNWAPISGEIQQSFTATQNGNYAVELTTPDLCIDTSICNSITGIGISELFQNNIKVYPNPTSNNITIEIGEGIENIVIEDITGKHLKEIKVDKEGKLNIDLPQASGIYFVKVVAKNGDYRRFKLIKK